MTEPQELTLAPVEKAPVAPLPSTADVGAMLHAVVNKGITTENVAAMESLVKLYEHMQAVDAKRAFAGAFNALQAEMPAIQAKKAVPDKQGNVKYRFAPFDEIMEQVRPLLLKHGFTLSFSTESDADRVTQLCTLTHSLGHSETSKFTARVGQGPPGASATQADGAASTYAKRYCLCNMLNIVIETDDDARAEGTAITKAQAQELEHRVAMLNKDKAAFLKFCHSPSFEEIPSVVYQIADDYLRRAEQKGK